ncbi:helix-turn-helix domain-containing protein [Desulfosporosinus nitroreducens]|uniref:helix-turn-helix domain-containing protein n=1 Tax=Desulfosporosinus nitroreducens TaxID=2018668 RepID=UPI00207D1047|nr:helix-turn-helix transcriptional regulator [Desulfosporosinus nitroreducens]MCO1599791.1 helix-turn-helix domain-containing protein [Desulfosporosinus nitroreducens]
MNDNIGTGRIIAIFRKSKRMTQSELANSVGISKGHIAAIEEGRKQPKIKTLARIAKCLGVEIEILLKRR